MPRHPGILEYFLQVTLLISYISSAFWGGLTFGRFALAWITNRGGEWRMIFLYIILCIGVQLVFWFVPSIVVGSAMIGILGFLLGPFFPVVRSSFVDSCHTMYNTAFRNE